MKKFFKPEDFNVPIVRNEDLADHCNSILQREIESWPVVFQLEPRTNHGWYEEKEHLHYKYKHKARLAFIEEIKKEPCKHQPVTYASQAFHEVDLTSVKCKHCGVELVAEWKPA